MTLALEILRHARLEKEGKQEAVIRELVLYDWPRTLSITGSATLTPMMLTAASSPSDRGAVRRMHRNRRPKGGAGFG